MEKVDTLVVDKTGTLTDRQAEADRGRSRRGLRRSRRAAPRRGARARQRASARGGDRRGRRRARDRDSGEPSDFQSHDRQGRHRHGRRTREVALGNAALMRRVGADPAALDAEADEHRAQGGRRDVRRRSTASSPGCSSSPTRSRTARREAIAELHRDGIRIVMLTGDNRRDRRSGRRARSASTRSSPRSCPTRSRPKVEQLQERGHAASPWPATGSTTRRRSPRRTSASRWAPAPTWRWRARRSRW